MKIPPRLKKKYYKNFKGAVKNRWDLGNIWSPKKSKRQSRSPKRKMSFRSKRRSKDLKMVYVKKDKKLF